MTGVQTCALPIWIELDGGTLIGNSPALPSYGTTVNGYLGGSGLVRGNVVFNGSSSLLVGSGEVLRFDADVSNHGSMTIDGGELRFLAGFDNHAAIVGPPAVPAGRMSIENGGTVRFAETLTNNGVISNAHGATNIYGAIDNAGDIVVARDTVATFYDTVNNTGTITVKPGGNALFLSDLMFIGLGSLELGVDTTDPTGSSAQISVGGVATLGGTLQITLDGGMNRDRKSVV